MQKTPQRLHGIGLLELMLSLAIIAIMLIMAVRYYQSANTNQSLSQAVDMVNAVTGAAESYTTSNASFRTSASPPLPTLSDLVAGGYLPNSYNSGLNSWGGLVCLNTGVDACTSVGGALSNNYYYVTLTGIPSNELCTQLSNRLISLANDGGGSGGSGPANKSAASVSDCTSDGGDSTYMISMKVTL